MFVCVFVFYQNVDAQLSFCSGNSGDPIFIETFGTGSVNNALLAGTTTYPYSNNYPGDGFYTVSNGTFGNSFDWHQTLDHSTGDTNGKCLIVNAAASAGEFYRTTIAALCETTTYEFSAWLINLVRLGSFCSTQPGGTIPINVRFEIWDATDANLLASGNTGSITQTSSPNWQEYGLVFQTLAGQNTVILKMINNGQGGCGNDLAIDDIEFKSCGDIVTVTDSNNNNSVNLCSSQAPFSSTLTAIPDFTVYNSHFYQWQESTDSGITWNDITGATNQTLPISVSSTTYYRAKIAEVAINLSNPQCVSFSDEYQLTINELPPIPVLDCWETATINNATCAWEISGTQPTQPTIECWEVAKFNTTSCSWDITGVQPTQPNSECWEVASFNTTACSWEVTGSQPTQPNIECWQTAGFNTTTCIWEISGVQPTQPTLQCWEIATFNTSTCSWDVTGTQPIQPNLECWQTTMFNTTKCTWDVFGTQPGNVTEENLELCEDNSLTLQSQSSISNPSYVWSTGATTEDIIIDTAGTYTVEVIGAVCSFETKVFNITLLEKPLIGNVASDGNDIIITTVNIGDFEYSIDRINFQMNNIFYDIEGGLYSIYVKQRNCSDIITRQHLHFYIPKYFTPNNDGVNDTFSLSGIEFYNSSEVSIFNRHGKLLKFGRNTVFNWDGAFRGEMLPSDDYWYIIIIEDQKFSGHFTLKR